MTDKRLFLLLPLALLAACNDAPADGSRAASGEVLEGTISDAMLPVDPVQSSRRSRIPGIRQSPSGGGRCRGA